MACRSSPSISDQVKFHDDGVAKPKVAIVKVIDSSKHGLSWDLSSEFTEILLERLFSSQKFFLTDDFHMIESSHLKNLELSPYSEDLRWLQELNSNSEFVLFTELLTHKILPPVKDSYNPLKKVKKLQLSMRVCVVDIRKNTPKIILQEIVSREYPIYYQMGDFKDESSMLKKNAFSFSPIGLAHKNIVQMSVKQIEDYILIAKSNAYE